MEFIVGIIVGWLVPRPAFIGNIERMIWEPIKSRLPESFRKFFG